MEQNSAYQYNLWNIRKQEIALSERTETIYFKERQVWWCTLGVNIGSESFGKGDHFRRPILIFKKLSAELYIALPLTSKEKSGTWFVDITLREQVRWVMLYQIRTLHKKRLQFKIGEVDDHDFLRIQRKLEQLLELSANHHRD